VLACGDPSRPHGWINDAIRDAYGELHRLGWAHCSQVSPCSVTPRTLPKSRWSRWSSA
jgi:hypothetical protein